MPSDPYSPPTEDDYPAGTLIKRLLQMSWNYRWGCLFVLLLQMLQLALTLTALGFTGLGIDVIHHASDPSVPPAVWPFGIQPPESWSPLQQLFLVASLILGFAIIKMVLAFTNTVAVGDLVHRKIVVGLRSQVYDKLQRLSFRFYDSSATGSIINRVTGDVMAVRMFIDGVVLPFMVVVISLAFYLTYMLRIHVLLTLACLATTPILYWMAIRFSRKVRPAYLHNRKLVDDMVLRLAETIQGIAVVKGFGREKEEVQRFTEAAEHVRTQQQWIFRQVSRFSPTIGFMTQINMMILLAYGGWLVIRGEIPLGTGLVVFASLLSQFSNQVGQISTITNHVQRSITGARRVFEVLDRKVEVKTKKEGAIRLEKARGDVAFENVSFEYKENATALREVNFEVKAGTCIAILGATGSGKSALLSLIPRFYDPNQGTVRLDGHDLRDLDLDDLRRSIGIVFQESFLFRQTIAENIAFGNPNATQDQIEKAAKIARAHDFIMAMPEGYDTQVGEGGSDLSGGQRQRVAIARAILLEPAILVLDDPTAAIDPQTEHEILEAMESAMRGRTTFVVAHRLSTLRRADLIFVLEKGRIIESGTHQELIQRGGHYQKAASLQIIDDDLESFGPIERSDVA